MKKKYFVLLLVLSLLVFIGAAICHYANLKSYAGPLMIGGFALLALAVRGFEAVKGISYTLWIFTAVAASMFYPVAFISVGGFQLKKLIVPLLQIIMFGMGSQMSFNDFAGVIKMPKGVIIGVFLQFTIMPLVGLTIANVFSFPPEIAAGIILIGCVPSGLASNVMSYLARANLALAVTISAVTTLLSPFITPTLMKWFGGQFIEVNFWSMMLDILNMIILPIIAGFIFNLFFRNSGKVSNKIIQLGAYAFVILGTNLIFLKVNQTGIAGFLRAFLISLAWFYFLPMVSAILLRYFTGNENTWMDKVLSMVSMVGIALIVAIITAAGRNSLLEVDKSAAQPYGVYPGLLICLDFWNA
jgi:BASS family bile acid:Na+ symporter